MDDEEKEDNNLDDVDDADNDLAGLVSETKIKKLQDSASHKIRKAKTAFDKLYSKINQSGEFVTKAVKQAGQPVASKQCLLGPLSALTTCVCWTLAVCGARRKR